MQVQHRGLRETSRGDVAAMTFVINLVADLFPEFSYRWYDHTPLDPSTFALLRGALVGFGLPCVVVLSLHRPTSTSFRLCRPTSLFSQLVV